MGGSGSTTTNIVRYAPYLESRHITYLDKVNASVNLAMVASPYAAYTAVDFDDALYGAGYAIGSFPSLYDMYGKFMAGLDIEVLFDEAFEETINGTVVSNAISQEASILEDDMENNILPRFKEGMRDINSVMSSTFIVGQAQLEAERLKAISRFSADLRAKLLPIVTERWKAHLNWNSDVVQMYAQIAKFAISVKLDTDNQNLEMAAKDVLWPFNALQYQTAALGTLSGATNTSSDTAGGSKTQRVIGSSLTGAASGAMIGAQIGSGGGFIGAGIGALVGLAAGLF